MESDNSGSITYLAYNKVYRAYLDPIDQTLQNDLIFTIDPSQFAGDTILDVMVADNFTVILLQNNYNFLAYLRPAIQGQAVTRAKTGMA